MAVTLRQVLQAFEQAGSSVRLDALSRQLGVDPGTLDGMIQHWVRKGRIQEVSDALPQGCTSCHGCDVQSGCPFVARMPRRYALATPPEPPGPVPVRFFEHVGQR